MERTLLYNCTLIDPASEWLCPDGVLVLEHGDGPDAPDPIGYCGPKSGAPDRLHPLPDDTWLDCEGCFLLPGLCDLSPRFYTGGNDGCYAALSAYRSAGAALLRGMTAAGAGNSAPENALRRASDELLLWAPKIGELRPLGDGRFLFDRAGGDDPAAIARAAANGLVPCAAGGQTLLADGSLAIAAAAETLASGGYSPMEALKAVTCNNASALGFGGTNGRLSPGYEGDLLLVRENPLEKPETLRQPVLTARGGRLIASRLKAMERTRLALLPPGYEL